MNTQSQNLTKWFASIIFLLMGDYLFCQAIFPTIEQKPVWVVSEHYFSESDEISIHADKDTIICGRKWQIITSRNTDESNAEETQLGYYIVEDGNKKVYYRKESDCASPTYTLYDFSLQEGDRLFCPFNFGSEIDTILHQVARVNYEYYYGKLRKVLYLAYTVNRGGLYEADIRKWVEGVGDLSHPFYPVFCKTSYCEASSKLEELYLNDQLTFVNSLNKRIYVNTNSDNAIKDGKSWESCYHDLQNALNAAIYGDTIWVAQGTYYPAINADREKSFVIKNGVVLLGGFTGFEEEIKLRSPFDNPTILSGNIGEKGDMADNSWHIIRSESIDTLAALDGFIVTEGYASTTNSIHQDRNHGGGLYIQTDNVVSKAVLKIKNCQFKNNTARFNGGAIYCGGNNTSLLISNTIFENNVANIISGGAIYKSGKYLLPSTNISLYKCSFLENKADSNGGAVYLRTTSGECRIESCTFENNFTKSNGGAIAYDASFISGLLKLNKCEFKGNMASDGGAFSFIYTAIPRVVADTFLFEIDSSIFKENRALSNFGGALSYNSLRNNCHIRIRNTSFSNNWAWSRGGAINVHNDSGSSSVFSIFNSIFNQNSSGSGAFGALYLHNFISGDPMSIQGEIVNSLFVRNTGAIGMESGFPGGNTLDIINSTFFENGKYPIAKNWSADFNDSTYFNTINVYNTILYERNQPLQNVLYNGDPNNLNFNDYRVSNSILEFNKSNSLTFSFLDETNVLLVEESDLFLDTLNNNFSPLACSPAVNAGSPIYWNFDQFPLTDILGNKRIQENNIDIGAIETLQYGLNLIIVQPPSCYGERDGEIEFEVTGKAPFLYEWERDSLKGENLQSLAAGRYFFTITDSHNCRDSVSIAIPQPDSLLVSYTVENASTPTSNDGQIILNSITGGTSPYQYLWSNNKRNPSLFNLAPGNYTVSITDQNNCKKELFFIVDAITNTSEALGDNTSFEILSNPIQAGQSILIKTSRNLKGVWIVKIFNANGAYLHQQSFRALGQEEVVTIPYHFEPGIYFIQAFSKKRKVKTLKLVVI